MYNLETLEKFRSKKFGCLSPEGNLIPCEMYEHKEIMGVSDLYQKLSEEYWDDVEDQLRDEQTCCGDNEYYHPAMHRFEMGDDTEHRAYQVAYSNGWIRLGIYGKEMFAFGTNIKINNSKLKEIALMLNLTLKIESN